MGSLATENDLLPKNICSDCLKKLEDNVEFLRQCIEAEKSLRLMNNYPTIKTIESKRTRRKPIRYLELAKKEKKPVLETIVISSAEKKTKQEKPVFNSKLVSDNRLVLPKISSVFSVTTKVDSDIQTEITQIPDQTESEPFDDDNVDFEEITIEKSDTSSCNICGKEYKTVGALKNHLESHKQKQIFICDFCNREFTYKERLKNHLRIHTGERPFQCKICKMTFAQHNALKCHTRLHTGDKPYACTICNKSFTQYTTLKTHMVLHTGKTLKCDQCDKMFARASFLAQHKRAHTGDRPYACHICPNRYRQKSHLDHHLEIHAGTKYACEICGRLYSKKWSLKAHSYIHTKAEGGKLPYTCEQCGESFVRKDKLKSHVRKVHTPSGNLGEEVPAPSNVVEIESEPLAIKMETQSDTINLSTYNLVTICTDGNTVVNKMLVPVKYDANSRAHFDNSSFILEI